MPVVKAKLYVAAIERTATRPDHAKITLGAVTRGNENKQWAEATPSASFIMTIQNPVAAAQFVLGQEYYVTFERAEAMPHLGDGHQWEAVDPKSTYEYQRRQCKVCGLPDSSHEEPIRSQIVKMAALDVMSDGV